ncbi:MAG: hypothetical protein RJR35_04010 [Thermoanaerobacterales bacterium]|nr:hypothetical protein [Thermoanaerobacterales bacterium]
MLLNVLNDTWERIIARLVLMKAAAIGDYTVRVGGSKNYTSFYGQRMVT